MARKKLEVDKAKLQAAIVKAEANGPLGGRSALWREVVGIYNADNPPAPINESVAYLRFNEMGLTCITPVGRKMGPMSDEQKAAMRAGKAAGKGMRRSRAEKLSALPDAAEHYARLRESAPKRYQSLVDRVEKGSLTAAIKLMCIQCVGYERVAVKDCKGLSCPMYLHRPYQKAGEAEADGEPEKVVPAVEA